MCFSADADFVSGAVIGVVGLATLTKVEKPREIPLAVLPLAFALHQVIEGFVWQNLDQGNARVGGVAVYLYVSFAWVVLPVLAPLAIMLLEPPGRDRRRMAVFVGLGMLAGAYLASSVFAGDISAHAVHHTIQYGGAGRLANEATVVYIVATCGAPLLSGFRAVVWFGVANAIAVLALAIVQAEGLTSLWCMWAAVVSVLIHVQFVWWRRPDTRQPGSVAHMVAAPD